MLPGERRHGDTLRHSTRAQSRALRNCEMTVAAAADKLRAEGKSVSVGSAPLADGKYRKIMRFDGQKLTEVKDNA